jgi:hypothetical protein
VGGRLCGCAVKQLSQLEAIKSAEPPVRIELLNRSCSRLRNRPDLGDEMRCDSLGLPWFVPKCAQKCAQSCLLHLLGRCFGGSDPTRSQFWFITLKAVIVGFPCAHPVNWRLVANSRRATRLRGPTAARCAKDMCSRYLMATRQVFGSALSMCLSAGCLGSSNPDQVCLKRTGQPSASP